MSAEALASAFTAALDPVRYSRDRDVPLLLSVHAAGDTPEALPSLVFADHLDETERPSHAELVRAAATQATEGLPAEALAAGLHNGGYHKDPATAWGDDHRVRSLTESGGTVRTHVNVQPMHGGHGQVAVWWAAGNGERSHTVIVGHSAVVAPHRLSSLIADLEAEGADVGNSHEVAGRLTGERPQQMRRRQQPVRYAADPDRHAAFQAAVAADQADHLPKQVYADYLEENGEHFDQPTLDLLRSHDGPLHFGEIRGKHYATTEQPHDYDAMRRANAAVGHHWFSPDTMRSFGTRLGKLYRGPGGHYFVTSERNPFGVGHAREYSVRRFHPESGTVSTIGDFGEHASGRSAERVAARLAGQRERPQQMQRPSQPVRYAKSKRPRVHPLLRGTRLALVLRELSRDPIEGVAHMAKVALYSDPTATPILADALEETDHPLYERYNWRRIPTKLHHDSVTLTALKRVLRDERRAARRQFREVPESHRHAHQIVIRSLTGYEPERSHLKSRLHAEATALLPTLAPDEIDDSLRRLGERLMHRSLREGAPDQPASTNEFWRKQHAKTRREKALAPEAANLAAIEDYGQKYTPHSTYVETKRAEEKALRYDRVRVRVGGVKNALRLMQSRNQQQYRTVATDVLKRLGLSPNKVRDGVTLSGAPVASVVAAIYHGGDHGLAEAAAAYFGHLMQLPSVTTFHSDDGGPDSLYKLSLPLAPAAAAQHLQRHGVTRCVLVPNRSGTDVLIHDPGRRQAAKVASAAQGGEVQETVGRSVRLGHADGHRADAASRKSYRSVISAFEDAANAGNQQPAADGDSASPGAAAGAAAPTAARD